jgi:hypothetical protein
VSALADYAFFYCGVCLMLLRQSTEMSVNKKVSGRLISAYNEGQMYTDIITEDCMYCEVSHLLVNINVITFATCFV